MKNPPRNLTPALPIQNPKYVQVLTLNIIYTYERTVQLIPITT